LPKILISGIVAARDKQPYLLIDVDGHTVQCSMADARNVARDIERMCARTEADAMIHKFFAKEGYPAGAGAALMIEFRDFRSNLDAAAVERTESDPSD
jgi:hypothetical protein